MTVILFIDNEPVQVVSNVSDIRTTWDDAIKLSFHGTRDDEEIPGVVKLEVFP